MARLRMELSIQKYTMKKIDYAKDELVIKEGKHVLLTHIIMLCCIWFVVILGLVTGDDSDSRSVLWGMGAFDFVLQFGMLTKYFFWRLKIGPQECYVRNRFGRKKYFTLEDIQRVELKNRYFLMHPVQYLYLLDQYGKKLAKVNLFTMPSGNDIFPYLVEYDHSIVKDEEGNEYITGNIPVVETVNKSSKKEIKRREMLESGYRTEEALYQTQEWIAHIRKTGEILSGLMLVIIIACILLPMKVEAWIYAIYPLILFGYFIKYRRVLVWRYPKETDSEFERTHVKMPDVTIGFLLSFFLTDVPKMNFTHFGMCLKFWMYLTGGLIILFVIFIVRKRGRTKIIGTILCLILYGYLGVYCWNSMFATEVTGHETAIVEEKNYEQFVYIPQYQINVKMADGEKRDIAISGKMYSEIEQGDKVTLRYEKSLFGLEYYYVELPV